MNNDLIRVDYDALAEIAGRFAREASQIGQMLQSISSKKSDLEGGGWEGKGSAAFYAEMEADVLPAVTRLQQALSDAGLTTARISQIWQQAEEDAANPFQSGGAVGTVGGPVAGGIGTGFWPGGTPGFYGGGGSLGGGFSGGDMFAGGSFGFYGDNDYGIPRDWLSGVTDGLGSSYNDYGIPRDWLSGVTDGLGNANDYGIPQDWLSGVTGGSGGETGGMAPGGGAPGGGAPGAPAGGSGAGAAGTDAQPAPSGGGSGGSAPESSIRDPYGSSRNFQRVDAGAPPAPGTGAAGKGFRFQSLGGGGAAAASSGGVPATGGSPAARAPMGGPAAAAGPSASGAIPFGIAAASPFVALLGKAVKGKLEDD